MVQSFCSWLYLWDPTINEGCLYLPDYMPISLLVYNPLLGNNCIVSSIHLYTYSKCLASSGYFHKSYLRLSKFSECLVIYVGSLLHLSQVMPWLVWLSGLSGSLRTQRLPVQFQVGRMPGSQARSPFGGVQEATNRCISHTLIFLSLPFSLLSPSKKK